jgi:hypothetical protein
MQAVNEDEWTATRLYMQGNYERAFEVATGFPEYFDIHREGTEGGASGGEQAAVMMGQATGFNQLIETITAEERSGQPLEGTSRILRGIDAGLSLVNTTLTVAGGVGGATKGGMPFSAKRAINRAVAAEAKRSVVPKIPTAKNPAAPRMVPVRTIENPGAKEIKREAKALEDTVNRNIRGTNSIRSASPEARKIQRGLSPPKSPAPPTGRRRIITKPSVDQQLEQTQERVWAERLRVAQQRRSMSPKDWNKVRAPRTKALYNLLERRAALFWKKTFPNSTILEQAHVLGVEHKGGFTSTKKIAGKGRIADIARVEGRKVELGDLKSPSTQIASIEGGLTSEAVDAEFRSSSEIGKQHEVEKKVVDFAKKSKGKIVVQGKDVVTGQTVTAKIDPGDVSSSVTDYYGVP